MGGGKGQRLVRKELTRSMFNDSAGLAYHSITTSCRQIARQGGRQRTFGNTWESYGDIKARDMQSQKKMTKGLKVGFYDDPSE